MILEIALANNSPRAGVPAQRMFARFDDLTFMPAGDVMATRVTGIGSRR